MACAVNGELGEDDDDPWNYYDSLHHDVPCSGFLVIRDGAVNHQDFVLFPAEMT